MPPSLLDGSKSMTTEMPKKKKKWMKSATDYADDKKEAAGKADKESRPAKALEKQDQKKKHKGAQHLMKSMYGKKE